MGKNKRHPHQAGANFMGASNMPRPIHPKERAQKLALQGESAQYQAELRRQAADAAQAFAPAPRRFETDDELANQRIAASSFMADTAMLMGAYNTAIKHLNALLKEKLTPSIFHSVHQKLAVIHTEKHDYLRALDHYVAINESSQYVSDIQALVELMRIELDTLLLSLKIDELATVSDVNDVSSKLKKANKYAKVIDHYSDGTTHWTRAVMGKMRELVLKQDAMVHAENVAKKLDQVPSIEDMDLVVARSHASVLSDELTYFHTKEDQLSKALTSTLTLLQQKVFDDRLYLMILVCYANSTKGYQVSTEDAKTIQGVIRDALTDKNRSDIHDRITTEGSRAFNKQVKLVSNTLTQLYSHRSWLYFFKSSDLQLSEDFTDKAKEEIQEIIRPKNRL